jgi:hypothetical protein
MSDTEPMSVSCLACLLFVDEQLLGLFVSGLIAAVKEKEGESPTLYPRNFSVVISKRSLKK